MELKQIGEFRKILENLNHIPKSRKKEPINKGFDIKVKQTSIDEIESPIILPFKDSTIDPIASLGSLTALKGSNAHRGALNRFHDVPIDCLLFPIRIEYPPWATDRHVMFKIHVPEEWIEAFSEKWLGKEVTFWYQCGFTTNYSIHIKKDNVHKLGREMLQFYIFHRCLFDSRTDEENINAILDLWKEKKTEDQTIYRGKKHLGKLIKSFDAMDLYNSVVIYFRYLEQYSQWEFGKPHNHTYTKGLGNFFGREEVWKTYLNPEKFASQYLDDSVMQYLKERE